jgi:hypothetical protein
LFIDFKKVPVCKFTSEIRKFRARNPVYQGRISCAKNAQKLTCEHLRRKKIFQGLCPLDPQGQGREREEGGMGKELGPPTFLNKFTPLFSIITLDGSGTFHGMGIISMTTPCSHLPVGSFCELPLTRMQHARCQLFRIA